MDIYTGEWIREQNEETVKQVQTSRVRFAIQYGDGPW
jgi:hypothetical protein